MKKIDVGAVLFAGALTLGSVTTLSAATMTLEGTVGDAKCGVKHMMKDAVACTKACVKEGADYALIVDGKAYTLKTSNDKDKAELAMLAGKMAKISGDVEGSNVMVKSVTMGMVKK